MNPQTCVECDAPTGHEPDCAIWLDQQKDAEMIALRAKVGELERVIAGTVSPFFAEGLRENIRARLIGEMATEIETLRLRLMTAAYLATPEAVAMAKRYHTPESGSIEIPHVEHERIMGFWNALNDGYSLVGKITRLACFLVEPLAARIAQLEAVEKRYQWIKDNCIGESNRDNTLMILYFDTPCASDFDTDIDAAIAAESEGQ